MSDSSKIQWTDSTFNPWIGCTHVSPGCENCYAETLMATRYGRVVWGERGKRSRTSASYWRKPYAWDRAAKAAGERRRVFCASLADVFDPHPSIPPEWRSELWRTIEGTPHLDWQLLTKRPEIVLDMVPHDWVSGFPSNVWIGTSVEDQRRADERIPHLLVIPAAVRFLSCEPLLGPVELDGLWGYPGSATSETLGQWPIHWVIIGGESGPGARPCDLKWVRWLLGQCREAGVAAFVKQMGASWYAQLALVESRDPKGGDPSEWPEDLRVREFPAVTV